MARNITLTLGSGLGVDLGPNFNLTADVGSVTPSTATKSELTSGKNVSVDDLATTVTITSTGTCTNSITQTIPCAGTTTTSTTTTTTTAAPTSVVLSARDIAITTNEFILYASINGGFPFDIYDTSIDGTLASSCGIIYTFNSVSNGDTIEFSTDIACRMNGQDLPACPPSIGSFTSYVTNVTGGTNNVGLSLRTDVFP